MLGKQEKTSLEQTGGHVISPISNHADGQRGMRAVTLPTRLDAANQLSTCTIRMTFA